MNQVEAHRLAAAINELRPEWPLASLSTFIRNQLGTRAYRDAAIALAWVACDETTLTPARVLEAGPWWRATQAGGETVSAISHHCPRHPEHKAWNCKPCAEEVVPAPEGFKASVRAELAKAPRPARATNPVRHQPTTDLDTTRARIDKETDHG